MKPQHRALLLGLGLSAAFTASAQDATIVNARIAVGDGPVIRNGSIVVRDGHIVAVMPGRPTQIVGQVIDASGMTALPGFIDGHKHINTGPLEKEQMQDLLDSGFTTVLSGGGPADGNLTLVQHIDSGLINGPHVLASGRVNLHGTPEEARAAIRAMAAQGIHFTGEMAVTPEPGPTAGELAVLRAAVDEGRKDGVQVIVHAVSTPAMVGATDAGVRHQVHLPNKDFMGYDDAKHIVDSGTYVLDLISFGDPIIDVFQQDDQPRFRTGLEWPESIAGANRDAQGRATGTEGAYTLINARRIWDASGGRALGYGSDQSYQVRDVLEHELKSLMVMFSMQDVIRILGPNTAAFLGMQDHIGTLAPGKNADIVLVQGNPFADFHDLLNTTVVLKDGKVVVDKRDAQARAAATDPQAAPAPAQPLVGTLSADSAHPDQLPAMSCRALSKVPVAQARRASAAESPATGQGDATVPAHCAVALTLQAGRGSQERLQLWLPPIHWNGSLLVLGGGTVPVPEAALDHLLGRGYAVAAAQRVRAGRATDADALHAGAAAARTLTQHYYGGEPRYVYWLGGASAGAVGLQAVAAYPADFDGVVVTGQGASAATADLTAFAARGGKVLEYEPASVGAGAYEQLGTRAGGVARLQQFYRLFLIPSLADGSTLRADWLTPLDEWVQRGRAPVQVLAQHLPPPGVHLRPPVGLVFEPPFGLHTLCAYPLEPQLQSGRGETPVDWLCLPGAQANP